MKRLSFGLSSILLLVVVGAHGADDKHPPPGHKAQHQPPPKMSEEERRREATREAIRRAVRGGSHDTVRVEKRYQSVSHEHIGQYVGSWVKLETYYGRKVEGVLRSVNGNMLYIDEHVGRGSASYPINKTKLSGLQVLR
ncbi:hypothetical protein EH243_05230 [Amphritea opalescens]|uniref:Uncharacterized protein n=1 Tax=Amphritea opalescens TaxID=2490544 RepID=A0A430KU70_9GAMM|nr:hypothetical protein [Amphritea opalescens]RTE66998.1 hypothetical protein EH243_05230 [Amphritea opalescens]